MKNRTFGIFLIFQIVLVGVFFLYMNFVIENSSHRYQEQELAVMATLFDAVEDRFTREKMIQSLLTEELGVKGYAILAEYGITSPKQLNNLDRFSNVETETKKSFHYNFFIFTCLIIISFIYYAYLRYRDTKKLSNSLDRVLSGDYNFEVKEYRDGDFDVLASDVYKITSLLKEKNSHANQEKKQLESVLSDISHQLKTPLTSMYVINDLLKDDKIDCKKKRELLVKNRNQLERIEWLVASLLKMSRLDSGVIKLNSERTSLKELFQKVVEPLQIPIELKGQELIVKEDDLYLDIDSHWTLEAFVNIVKNAHEHTNAGGIIKINWEENPLYYEITIQDNGNGIKKNELPHIFERFYKGSSNKESIGIGLNMSKTIIEKQNGIIQVVSEEGKGTTFFIRFYKGIV